MYFTIMDHEPVHERCRGCVSAGPRIVSGDNTVICRRHAQPRTKWWFGWKCEDYKDDR